MTPIVLGVVALLQISVQIVQAIEDSTMGCVAPTIAPNASDLGQQNALFVIRHTSLALVRVRPVTLRAIHAQEGQTSTSASPAAEASLCSTTSAATAPAPAARAT